jgi:DNA mismatch repair protein MutS
LRQNALIAILAQMGSFVPAKRAHIGVIDRLFSRVGAADDLARGRSTFMVEMIETAAILNQATERSLIILDEIGRGTATFDGLAIAWAAIEHLHETNRARALFATHFHELTRLAGKLGRLVNLTVRVTDWQGEVIFLHEIVSGAADRSYGIQVAKLAGLPAAVVARARELLAEFEAAERVIPVDKQLADLPLFAVPPAPPAQGDLIGHALDALNPDGLSPREALDELYRLKEIRTKER